MERRSDSLFWRLLVPNVAVLTTACVVLIVEPANGRIPALAGGLAVMVVVNALVLRRATAPLARLTTLMGRIDPMRPGERLPVPAQESEIRLLAEAFNDMLDRLEAERREAGMRALNEREGERRRVAGELHDQIGQTLTALGLQADRVALLAADEGLRRELHDLRDGVLASVEDVRRLARELRPEALDTLGLIPALTNLSERMTRRTGIEIRRRLERDLPPLDPDTEMVIYRIAQESLTNAVRHARPRTIELTMRRDGDRLLLDVCDDGVGIDAERRRESGIRGMRERALSIGAELRVGRRASGNGTEVMLEVPTWRR
ncbi:MAG TPA: sensor histidine kinase [Baekduia sp.]|uniref:HAMP domain-containing sensor histidine kinase n=1 Tax=Baekduia sp. TaxID=2600305 RepID=UPI002D7756D4|nr:sensor histidine kinase [Baekduia sp.]HET6507097.1 sensor histidine kinase [Baekduia sp.]